MENEEQDRIRKEYYKSLCDNNAPPNGDGIKSKHSYFLRAKAAAPRYMGFQVSDDEDGRASSSICKSFLSSQVGPRKWDVEYCSEEEDLANCLVMLSNNNKSSDHKDKEIVVMEKGMFQCKACKKVFNSHQALGGHRASHKKVKGCFASKLDDGLNDDDEDEEENNNNGSKEEEEQISLMPTDQFDAEMTTKRRVKMHECSVCRRVFSSGQALGGHKRCHWLTTSTDNAAAAFIPNFQYHHTQQFCEKPNHHEEDRQLDLNLNLPPPPHQDHDIKSNKYEASTRLCLQQYKNEKEEDIIDKTGMKLRKLSDLRDVNMDGGWLQMGIAASNTTEMT